MRPFDAYLAALDRLAAVLDAPRPRSDKDRETLDESRRRARADAHKAAVAWGEQIVGRATSLYGRLSQQRAILFDGALSAREVQEWARAWREPEANQ